MVSSWEYLFCNVDLIFLLVRAGVVFLVAFMFLLLVVLEKMWKKLAEKYQVVCGGMTEQEEDPAALVGTFKRYKN